MAYFLGDFYLEESHLCEVAVVIELALDLARVVDERKIALQLFCWRVKKNYTKKIAAPYMVACMEIGMRAR